MFSLEDDVLEVAAFFPTEADFCTRCACSTLPVAAEAEAATAAAAAAVMTVAAATAPVASRLQSAVQSPLAAAAAATLFSS